MYRQFQGQRHHYFWIVLAVISAMLLASCGSTSAAGAPTSITPRVNIPTLTPDPSATSAPTPTPTSAQVSRPTPRTVFLIMMENHNWSAIQHNPSAPYINNVLLPMASYAEQYYNPPGIHPSEPNYLWLEAGTNFGVHNDGDPRSNHQSTTNHLVTLLSNVGISWKSYQEGIDGTRCPLRSQGRYAPKHNPMIF